MIRYALLGGSFDPVHNGHLHIAREILDSGAADAVAFLPNARHNFKKDSILLDYAHRYDLVQKVLEPGMEIWDDDAEDSGFTSDLIKRLLAKYPGRAFLWVIGSDNLASLRNWHDFTWLRKNVRFLIIPRPGYPCDPAALKLIRRKVLKTVPIDISSTMVRERIAEGRDLTGLVPDSIAGLITKLYKPLITKNGKTT
jgi:nicotinate-nucleotide adenylyltransferase